MACDALRVAGGDQRPDILGQRAAPGHAVLERERETGVVARCPRGQASQRRPDQRVQRASARPYRRHPEEVGAPGAWIA